ncbi:hypothetical protein AGLY_000092 [Aphis glycines]|uniref:Uncharacterized protein n=1 Tax=Aphis glycines TaxID=307491 RepID=A0A6G0U600_APHGL|nr:hypothetical protein AGLY_000092 [Aphis glycines]
MPKYPKFGFRIDFAPTVGVQHKGQKNNSDTHFVYQSRYSKKYSTLTSEIKILVVKKAWCTKFLPFPNNLTWALMSNTSCQHHDLRYTNLFIPPILTFCNLTWIETGFRMIQKEENRLSNKNGSKQLSSYKYPHMTIVNLMYLYSPSEPESSSRDALAYFKASSNTSLETSSCFPLYLPAIFNCFEGIFNLKYSTIRRELRC